MIHIQGINKSIPTSYDDVDFETYIALMNCGGDTFKILSVLTGVSEATLDKARIKNLDHVLRCLQFISQETKLVLPKTIAGYLVPSDLNFESIAKFKDVQTVIATIKQPEKGKSMPTDELVKLAEVCAIYACPGEYDYRNAEKIIPVMMKAPCLEVLALGNFILLKWIALKLGTEIPSLKAPTLMKRLRLALISWRARLAFTIRYALWKRRHRIEGMNF